MSRSVSAALMFLVRACLRSPPRSPLVLPIAERLSSDFGASCPNGVCPPGVGFGSNLNESQVRPYRLLRPLRPSHAC